MKDAQKRRELVLWVAHRVMPHEPVVRAWLARSSVSREDADDIVQEAYCRISALSETDSIARPGAFFFQVVRNILLNQIKRARIVRIDALTEIDLLVLDDDLPSPERSAGDRLEWDRIRALIDTLPERCRQIFELRKVEGLSQREIATRLGITENVVENEAANGLRALVAQLRLQGDMIDQEYRARREGRARR